MAGNMPRAFRIDSAVTTMQLVVRVIIPWICGLFTFIGHIITGMLIMYAIKVFFTALVIFLHYFDDVVGFMCAKWNVQFACLLAP